MSVSAAGRLFLPTGLWLGLEPDQAEWPVPEKPGRYHSKRNTCVSTMPGPYPWALPELAPHMMIGNRWSSSNGSGAARQHNRKTQ